MEKSLKYYGKSFDDLFGDDYCIATVQDGGYAINAHCQYLDKVFNEFGIGDVSEIQRLTGDG